MGLFDTVHCEYPLPDPRLADREFQTKDLECCLETYTITADGRLVRHARRPPGGRPGLDRDVEWPIHGDVLIYTGDPDRERGLVDLVVRFTHGRVESIRRLAQGESPRGAPPPQPWTFDWPRSFPPAADGEPPSQPMTGDAELDVPRLATADAPGERASAAVDGGRDDVEEERDAERRLLDHLHRDRAMLEALLARCDQHWGAEDAVYRFYHQSFKVYGLQQTTEAIVERLRLLAPAPECELDPWFREIVSSGTGLRFEPAHNEHWLVVTRPIVEAFFHARYFLEMAVRYASLEEPPRVLPSGWAALLHLYRLR